LIACTACGAEMPDYSVFCPACGRAATKSAPRESTSGLAVNLAAALAYFTFVPAVILLLVEPFKSNRFVRFHAYQSLFLDAAVLVVGVALRLLFLLLFLLPFVGRFLWLLLWMLLSIAWFLLWCVLVIKAFQRQMFKLPVLGNWAERSANEI
jgi:uncharacterized membrane protein